MEIQRLSIKCSNFRKVVVELMIVKVEVLLLVIVPVTIFSEKSDTINSIVSNIINGW